MEHDELMERMRRSFSVVLRGYASAARHLVPLVTPGALVLVPLSVASTLIFLIAVNDSAIVANRQLELTDVPLGMVLLCAAVVPVISLVMVVLVFPAVLILAVGLLVERRVPARAALRAAARRVPAMLALTGIAVLVLALIVAAGFGTLLGTGTLWVCVTVMAVLVLVAMPAVLAVPCVILEGRSPLGAVGRAYRMCGLRADATAVKLAIGVWVLPVLAVRALDWGVEHLTGPLATVVPGTAGPALALMIMPFQAAVVARQFLHHIARIYDDEGFDAIVKALPGPPPRRVWAVPVLAALLAPGLVFSAAFLVNPLGWPEVTNLRKLTWSQRVDDNRLLVYPEDVRALYADPGGGLTVFSDHEHYSASKLLTCADIRCDDMRVRWSEKDEDEPGSSSRPPATATRLPDGRLLLLKWARMPKREWHARLLICDRDACAPAPGGQLIARARDHAHLNSALALRPGGGVVIAQANAEPEEWGPSYQDTVSFTLCDDVSCTRPRTKQASRMSSPGFTDARNTLAVAVGPDGRPVAVRTDVENGAVHVISCMDPACDEVRARRPLGPVWPNDMDGATDQYSTRRDQIYEYRNQIGARLAVRADGRPVIAYRDAVGGAVRLLDCRTPDCALADSVTLDPAGREHAVPALALDRDGRALVAYQDLARRRIMLATCAGIRCTTMTVSKMRHGPGRVMAMTLDAQGRPLFLWEDDDPEDEEPWDLFVTVGSRLMTERLSARR
ncbi:hypothetical protein ETD86_03645 [Nonomuraea turkmeniaca]|uniref:Uncharacterized protein n=1 Tax=Nonomuraea turkmeniaca TaxID=103838 RepID=A0A5S4FV62_9ACTN|nr:hypothetical protein [Nonomuraea turkmeniaca]TMR24666.1 hypothetical protein ETD86_03645 [Nonomuraea turkmeniaca]